MANTMIRASAPHRRLVRPPNRPLELLGRSPAIQLAHDLIRRAASSRGCVLLVAERGVELEPIARELHEGGASAGSAYVVVDCAESDPARIEHKLFGALTDTPPPELEAVTAESAFATARGGTLFLHDVGELPSSVQARLARIARDGEMWLGGEAIPTSIRLVASAGPTLDSDVRSHRFRADLYRRLAVSRIDWPSLRDRASDIPEMVGGLLEELSDARGERVTMTEAAVALLSAIAWPGNLGEVHTVLDAVLANAHHDPIQIEDLLPALRLDPARAAVTPTGNLREARLQFERDYIAAALRQHNWRMAEAAQALGIQRPNLYRKARQLGIPLSGGSE
jgi:DNA-binding NtrC family response regulator